MKEARQRAILELVRERPDQTQLDLARSLGERGHHATQATVSRDIQELGLVRTGSGYRVGTPVAVAGDLILSIQLVEFVAVVRTPPGTASLVARAIDESTLAGIAGTVAGDDTVLVVLADRGAHPRLKELLGA
ncbi:MAG: arginine repressor [Candidatus Dormibacteraeota bacterium]|nr:arginine repressor [Candidatus Dormibacteraeota bacterium]